MAGFIGVTAIDTNLAEVTVIVCAGLVIPSLEAVIWLFPIAFDVANPEASMVATLVLLDDQVALAVISFVLPSE